MQKHTFKLMLVFAVIADGISAAIALMPAVGQIANPVFSFFVLLTLWLWFALKGLGLQGALWGGAGTMIEAIPFLQILPSFTAVVVAIYLKNKAADALPLDIAEKTLK